VKGRGGTNRTSCGPFVLDSGGRKSPSNGSDFRESFGYVEGLNDARTPLAGFFIIAERQYGFGDLIKIGIPGIPGDVIGTEQDSQMATPVGARDGGVVAHNALSGQALRKVDHRVIPRAIFIDPQIGVVGMTDEEANAAGHHCWCNTVPMALVPRAGAIRDTRGLIKMVADADTNEVLGVSMLGVQAGEVVHEAAMAMRFHAKIEDFIDLLHVYPTMAEALKIVAISRYKDPSKLSCCAE